MTTHPPRGASRRLAVPLLLAALTLAALGGVVANGFIELDDGEYLTRNDMVRHGLTARGVVEAFTTTRHGFIWHPVTWVSHMLDVELFGMAAGGHHAVSLALHLANALLLFALLRALTGALWRSAAVAALFAVHPLHVESVAWAAERKDVLSTLFALCTAHAYVRAVRRGAVARSVSAPLLFALALLSKAMVVTLPFLLLLLDWWPLGRWRPGARPGPAGLLPPARLWAEKAVLFALCAVSGSATYLAQDAGGTVSTRIPAALRLANAGVAYARYLGKTVWPQGLSPFYPYPFEGIPAATVAVAFTLLAAISVLAARQAVARPYLLLGWLWYLGTLVPVVGFVQAGGQAMADRYTYVPVTGLFVAAAWGVREVAPRRGRLAAQGGVLLLALLVALAAAARAQVALWRGTRPLFEHAVRLDPGNWVAWTALGTTYAEEGRLEEAAERYRRALAISTDYFDSNHRLGVTLAALGRPLEALEFLERAAAIRADDPFNNHILGRTLLELGRPGDAVGHLLAASRRAPGDAPILADLGAALLASGRPAEALQHFEQLLRAADAPLQRAVAGVLDGRGLPEQAAAHLARAVEIDPRDAAARAGLGEILFRLGRPAEAIVHLREAVALDPGEPVALNNLGAALAQSGHLAEAEAAFSRAVALDGRSADARLNHGLALLDLGRPEEAAAELLEAAALDPANTGVAPALARLRGQPGGEEAYARALAGRPRAGGR